MRIASVHLKNFRGFEDITVDLEPHVNVIVGINGAGKSSLLEGIARGIYAFGRQCNAFSFLEFDSLKDVRRKSEVTGSRATFNPQYPCQCEVDVEHHGKSARSVLTYDGGKFPLESVQGEYRLDVKRLEESWPLLLFFPAERHWGHMQQLNEVAAVTRKSQRVDAYNKWNAAATNAQVFFSWFVEKSMERMQLQAAGKENLEGHDLEILRKTLQPLLRIRNIYYDFIEKDIIVDWEASKDGGTARTAFSSLSDGEKEVICLFSEIVRRMGILNPHLGAETVTRTDGVVLIDELDLHLHPSWQRKIVTCLHQAFPQIQFIVTTHSPQILGEVRPENVILLNNGAAEKPQQSFGLSTDSILTRVMETSATSKDIETDLGKISRLVDEDKIADAQNVLEALQRKVGYATPEMIRLQTLIEMFKD
ncbi:MAG: AAA family ATPase [Duodenibacillus sp.]|nr:AAA family ATPase [Duodenibacillus sp.]